MLRQQTQPKSTTCVPWVVFRETKCHSWKISFHLRHPHQSLSSDAEDAHLAVDGWTALEKPNRSPSGKAARSPMDFEERNDLYVVGECDEGGSGLTAHRVAMAGVARGSVRQKGRFPLRLPRCQPRGLSCFIVLTDQKK